METLFNWSRLEKIEAAVAWHREAENAPIANVWHTDTVEELAVAIRRLLELCAADERLISLLWNHVPGDNRIEVANELERPGGRYVQGADRLADIVNRANDASSQDSSS